MKIFDIKNITRNAVKELERHMSMLDSSGKSFVRSDDRFYIYFEKESQDYMQVSYNLVKKIISRTYNMEFVTVIKNIDYENAFSLKLKYNGFPNTTDIYFQNEKDKGSKELETIFNGDKLRKELLKLTSIVDLAYCKIEYRQALNDIKISICPYAGSYLWVVFPPVFYSLKLSRKEMVALYSMGDLIRSHINTMLLDSGCCYNSN